MPAQPKQPNEPPFRQTVAEDFPTNKWDPFPLEPTINYTDADETPEVSILFKVFRQNFFIIFVPR